MYKDDYISAFGKLAPSEEWMADTLAKMRAAEAEQEAPGAAGPAGRPALRVSGKKHLRLRRAALPVAAAVALLAVPAAWFWGVAMRPAGSAAPAQYSLQSAGGAADEGRETEQAPRVAAAQDTAGTASSAAAAPETTEDAQAGARKEGRLLFAAEGGGMGMGDITVRTDADLAGANPTYDLPAGELPTELPVYAVPDGEAEMRAALEDTAAKLGGTLEAFSYDTSGPPDTAYYSPYASGKADGVS